MTVYYRNPEGSTATGVDATYTFAVYATDMWGRLVVDESNVPVVFAIPDATVMDDGEGTLSFSILEARSALDYLDQSEYMYTVCFVITTADQQSMYIPIY